MEPSSPLVQKTSWTSQCFIGPFQPNWLPSNHVEKADTGRKTRWRWARGCGFKTGAASCVEDSQSVSNSAEFEYISKPRKTYSKKFKFWVSRYGEARSYWFEWEPRIKHISEATRCKSELQRRDTCCESGKEVRWHKIVSPQSGHITKQRRVPWESLLVRTTISWSSTKQRCGTDRRQRDDLGMILCPRQWKRRYILETIIKKIYVPPRTQTSTRSSLHLTPRGNWSLNINMKYIEYPRLIGIPLHGWRSFLLNDKAIKLSAAKVCVCSDSVLCRGGRIAECPQSVVSWKDGIDWFTHSPQYRELDNIDREPVVFEWKNFLSQGTSRWSYSRRWEAWWRKITFSHSSWTEHFSERGGLQDELRGNSVL